MTLEQEAAGWKDKVEANRARDTMLYEALKLQADRRAEQEAMEATPVSWGSQRGRQGGHHAQLGSLPPRPTRPLPPPRL